MNAKIDVFCGLDVDKRAHYATALNRGGERLYDHRLPQDGAKLEAVFTERQSHGRVSVIVDQPNTIGVLPIAVARDAGYQGAYLAGLAMRNAANPYPGNAKTDVTGMRSSSPRPPVPCRTRFAPGWWRRYSPPWVSRA